MNSYLWIGAAVAAVGVVVVLVGFRRRGRVLKLGGLALVAGGFAVCVFFAPKAAEPWERHTTSDGACSAEFPKPPTHEVVTADKVTTDSLTAARPDRNAHFIVSFSDLSDIDAPRPVADIFADLRSLYAAPRSNGPRADLLREEAKDEAGVPGREFHFAVADKLVSRIRVFVKGRRVYRAIAVYPPGADADRDAQRFVASFRLEGPKP